MTELLDDFYPTIIYLHYLKRENEIVTIHFGGGALTVHPKISFTVSQQMSNKEPLSSITFA